MRMLHAKVPSRLSKSSAPAPSSRMAPSRPFLGKLGIGSRWFDSGGGHTIPPPVRTRMEAAFNADFSGGRVHIDSKPRALGATAYTRGSQIHFAPGQYRPDSRSGQELLGH